MLVDDDLRRQIRSIMATRLEQVLFFSGDESLQFGEVSRLLAELQADDPRLWIAVLTRQQMKSVGITPETMPICLTGSTP